MSSPARDSASDSLKAMAIFAVVFIHTPGRGAGSLDEVLRFCVPVFIALWAYYFELALARRPADQHAHYVRDKFVRLLVPFVFWTAVYLPIRYPPADWPADWRVHLDWWTGGGWPGQYFFVVLLQLVPFVYLTRRFVGRRAVLAVVAAGPVGYLLAELAFLADPTLRWDWGNRTFVHWLPYAALGIALARGYVPPLPVVPVAVVAAVVLALVPVEVRSVEAVHPDPPKPVLVSACVGSLALILALGPRAPGTAPSPPRPGRWVDALIGYVGRNTFPVFVLHVLVLTPVGAAFSDVLMTAGAAGLAARAAAAAGAIAASLGLAWVIRRVGLGVLIGG